MLAVSLRLDVVDAEALPVHFGLRPLLYLPWLLVEIVKANVDVAKIILSPSLPIHPHLIRVPASQRSEVGQVMYANSVTLTPGTISLCRWLEQNGVELVVGGSLPRSLHATGKGFEVLQTVFPTLDVSNGSGLISESEQPEFLNRLLWPELVSGHPYLSARPVVPLTLSTGCYWSKCMFCPDRDMHLLQ